MTKLNDRIRALCEKRGMTFKPWEIPPWDVPDSGPSPWPSTAAGSLSWPKAQKLRCKLIAELRAAKGK